MIERYGIKEIENIWSEDNKLNIWLDVEIQVVNAWVKLGIIPEKDAKEICSKAKVNRQRMLEIEEETKHDVVAFTRMISETLSSEKKWIHLGLTSTDIVDTAQNKMIQQSNILLEEVLNKMTEVLKQKAIETKDIIIMGRTHGMYGEPTSLGLKFLLWFDEIKRQLERLKLARKQIEVAKISGSMGNYANLEIEVEEFVANKMNLNIDNISTQVTQRDRHAFLISVIANIASTLEKISTEIRHFQRSEVQEICEGFGIGQKGSSSMPHKKNPISSENICGLSRYARSFVNAAFENNVLWHERDISHSSNERLIFPDIYNIIIYVSKRMNTTINDLVINKDKIDLHINEQKGLFFSQRILTYILMNYDFSREQVYDFVQKCTLEAQSSKRDFKEVLIENGIKNFIAEQEEIDNLFDINFFLRNVEKMFRRVMENYG
ncbi:adenylosuccinate lyase [Spiroplasma diminutum]|uniref:Adenylosuccinate lyase n=1 Tax=Spiroplasma diminutum CUAS-1 TaxID=1276221 RepID=S5MKN6_9MOLU|nr:adenylosuccinate lyase [Spiroplasma diminutum]AGR42540.1 adenylosuccinate lyase [Spiroplasma diminutum CUAS-1]